MNWDVVERIGFIVAGGGMGAKLIASSSLWIVALVGGILVAGYAAYRRHS